MIMTWRDQMNLNYLPLDQEHKDFLDVVNKSLMIAQSGDTQKMNWVFDKCYDYVRNHFAHEEEIMDRIGFPDLKAHAIAHQTFIKNISECRKNYEAAQTPAEKIQEATKTADFLSLWLVGHILSRDKLFKPYLVRLRHLPPRMNYDKP